MFESHHTIIKQYLKATLGGDINSMMIVGSPGIGKTRLVMDTLAELRLRNNEHYVYVNSYFTALELFLTLEKVNRLAFPKMLVLDDAEYSLRDRKVVSILKSALWETNQGARQVNYLSGTYKIGSSSIRNFEGKIIVLLNEYRATNPLLSALKDRGLYYSFEPSQEEIRSAILELAKNQPFKDMPQSDRVRIASRLIETSKETLSLRSLVKAYHLHLANRNQRP